MIGLQGVIERKPNMESSQRRGWQRLWQKVESFPMGKLRLKENLDWWLDSQLPSTEQVVMFVA